MSTSRSNLALSCSSSSASRAMLASYAAASSDVASGSRLSSYVTTPHDSATCSSKLDSASLSDELEEDIAGEDGEDMPKRGREYREYRLIALLHTKRCAVSLSP